MDCDMEGEFRVLGRGIAFHGGFDDLWCIQQDAGWYRSVGAWVERTLLLTEQSEDRSIFCDLQW